MTVRRRLGEVLVDQGAISEAQLDIALGAQRDATRQRRRVRLGTLVVELGFATERQVAAALATALSLDLLDTESATPDPEVARLLPEDVASRLLVLPIAVDATGRVTLACADPTNATAIDEARSVGGIGDVRVMVATSGEIRDLIGRVW